MNFAPGAENVRLHLGVPITGLVTKVHASFKHLAHGDVCHVSYLHTEDSNATFSALKSWVNPPRSLSGNPGLARAPNRTVAERVRICVPVPQGGALSPEDAGGRALFQNQGAKAMAWKRSGFQH